MATIIKLIENESSLNQIELVWVKVLCANGWESKMAELARWLLSSSLSQNEWELSFFECKMAGIQDGPIQDGCHHQVTLEGMSLSQIELVWFRVRVEWECFWGNLREDKKVSESKMAVPKFKHGCHYQFESEQVHEVFCTNGGEGNVSEFFCANGGNHSWQVWVSIRGKTKMVESKMARIEEGCHHQVEVRMNEFESDWISLSQSFVQNGWIQDGPEFKMAAIIKLCQNEWVWVRLNYFESEICAKWLNARWQNSRWSPSSSCVRMNDWSFFLCRMVECKMAEFKMAAIIKLSENEWVWVRLN